MACAFPNPAQNTAIASPASPTPTLLIADEAAANNTAVGAPPSAQAGGKGSANAKARIAQDAGKSPRRRDTSSNLNKALDMTELPVSPPIVNVLAGNRFAPLSQLTDETPSLSPERTAATGGSRRVVIGRKPDVNARQRKAVTLGDFLPTGGLTSKGQDSRHQRLSMELSGSEGPVCLRVPRWNERGRLTETTTVLRVTVNITSTRKRRRRVFAGLRGKVSNHFPTCALRYYRTWNTAQQPHRPAPTSVRPPVLRPPRGTPTVTACPSQGRAGASAHKATRTLAPCNA